MYLVKLTQWVTNPKFCTTKGQATLYNVRFFIFLLNLAQVPLNIRDFVGFGFYRLWKHSEGSKNWNSYKNGILKIFEEKCPDKIFLLSEFYALLSKICLILDS